MIIHSFVLAAFVHFLDYCFIEDEIFGKWRPFLCKTLGGTSLSFLINPLGDCIVCMTPWLALLSFPFFGMRWYWIIPYIVISTLFVRIIDKLIN